jgi:hypothetical protein
MGGGGSFVLQKNLNANLLKNHTKKKRKSASELIRISIEKIYE